MTAKSCEKGHICLVPNHRGCVYSFSLLSMVLAVGIL